MNRTRLWILILAVVAVAACAQKESPPPQTQAEAPEIPYAQPGGAVGADTPAISAGAPVVLPDAVKGKWTAVQLMVEDKEKNTTRDFNVKLQDEVSVPDSVLKIKVLEFIPDLKIEGNSFTSASEELLNPAVHVVIHQEDKEIFNGWLFQLFPSVHPFQHDRYAVVLKGPVSEPS